MKIIDFFIFLFSSIKPNKHKLKPINACECPYLLRTNLYKINFHYYSIFFVLNSIWSNFISILDL